MQQRAGPAPRFRRPAARHPRLTACYNEQEQRDYPDVRAASSGDSLVGDSGTGDSGGHPPLLSFSTVSEQRQGRKLAPGAAAHRRGRRCGRDGPAHAHQERHLVRARARWTGCRLIAARASSPDVCFEADDHGEIERRVVKAAKDVDIKRTVRVRDVEAAKDAEMERRIVEQSVTGAASRPLCGSQSVGATRRRDNSQSARRAGATTTLRSSWCFRLGL